jgi:hypothetical protein
MKAGFQRRRSRRKEAGPRYPRGLAVRDREPTTGQGTRWDRLILPAPGVWRGGRAHAACWAGPEPQAGRCVCVMSGQGELIAQFRAPVDRDGLYGLTRRVAVYEQPVRGVVESIKRGAVRAR